VQASPTVELVLLHYCLSGAGQQDKLDVMDIPVVKKVAEGLLRCMLEYTQIVRYHQTERVSSWPGAVPPLMYIGCTITGFHI